MADLVQDNRFIYSRVKTPFTWYEASSAQAANDLHSLVNGDFETDLRGWVNANGLWAWNAGSGGMARYTSAAMVSDTLTQIYSATPKLTFATITVKAISGGFCVLKILNSVTNQSTVTANITTTGTYNITGVGDTILIIGSGIATIDVDDIGHVILESAPQLNENRAYCKNECPYKLFMGATTFLNFALVRKTVATDLKYIIFMHEDGTTIYFNTAQIASQLGITDPTFQDRSGQVWDYFIYHGQDHTRYFKCGYWKGWATDGEESLWFSETFYIGEYGAEEIPSNNRLVNPNFDTDLSGWSVLPTPGIWTWGAGGYAVGSGTGVLEQALPFAPGIKKLRFKVKVLSLSSPIAIIINTFVGGITGGAKIISTPGIHYVEGYGDQVYISIVGVTEVKIEWAAVYVLHINPNLCHTKLTWKNSCDLFNFPYSSDFTNELYLENPALTMAPGWKEELEVVKDGAGRETKVAFRKMKDYLLETAEIPEYVFDSISLMDAHNDVKLSLPVYSGQKNIIIRDMEMKNEWLDGECYASAAMRLTVEDMFDTSCCDSLNYQVACKEVCLTVKSLCTDPDLECPCITGDGNFYLASGIHEIFGCFGPDTVLNVITNNMIPIPGRPAPYDDIEDMFSACTGGEVLILNEDDNFWYIWVGTISYPAIPVNEIIDDWITIYEIFSIAAGDDPGCVIITGFVPFWAFGYIEISTDAGANWTEVAGPLTQAQLIAGYQICDLEPGETLFRIHTKNLNCEYGRGASETFEVPAFRELRDSGDIELRDDAGDELRDTAI